MSAGQSFTAAMVQMCSGLLPEANLEQGIKLIRQAVTDGADYVQTPEVSNMIQANRKALFEHLASEEDDLSLKAYRAVAAELKIHLHIGSLALRFSPEKAVNRSFLIGPDGMVLASYDKIHMFDIDLPGGESYRESANYQPGETAVISDLPWGRIGLTICYDMRFPALYRALAAELKIHLHIGSLALRFSPEKAVNRSFLIGPDGMVLASYDKIHMFDIDLPGGESYRESANYQPGETAVISDLPWGRIGLTICYDMRFPALYRALAESGASFLTAPSAFTVRTGEAHWHTLLRARAIENGCFVFAAAQAGTHESKRQSYGHSLIVAPWGEILAEGGGTETGIVMAKIDPALVETARKTVPSLQHGRRFGVADPKAGPEHLHLVRGSA